MFLANHPFTTVNTRRLLCFNKMSSLLLSSLLPRQAIDLDGPTIPPPSGSVSDFDSPPNGNHIAIPLITLCAVISAISYSIRIYAKYVMKKLNTSDCESIRCSQ